MPPGRIRKWYVRAAIAPLLGLAALLLAAPPSALATDFAYYIKISGGSDSNGGTNWSTAWATLQRAWNQIDTEMGGNNETYSHVFDIYLEQTAPGQAMGGAAGTGDWWGFNNGGTEKRATISHYGGYDPSSGLRTGRTTVTNAPGRSEAFYIDLFAAHPQYAVLRFYDVIVLGSSEAVEMTDQASPRFEATRSVFTSTGSTNPVLRVWNVAAVGAASMDLSRCVISNGNRGIYLTAGTYRSPRLTMVNSAITGQSGAGAAGIYVESGDNSPFEPTLTPVLLTNVTISAVAGGAGIIVHKIHEYGYNLNVKLYKTAIAGVDTVCRYESVSFAKDLVLSGATDAFLGYVALTNVTGTGSGKIVQSLTSPMLQPGGNAGFAADGYHLTASSPLLNIYPVQPSDPVVDIHGHVRPQSRLGDIGADEFVPPRGTLVTFR